MSRERRGGPRKPLAQRALVTDCVRDDTLGTLANLSRNGVMLISQRALRDDALYQVRFRLPGTDTQIELGLHTMWTHAAATNGYQWSGLRTISISDDATELLDRWLAEPSA